MSRLLMGILALSIAVSVALVGAETSSATGSNAAGYRAQVNAICRSYTPKFRQLLSDMASAKRAGDNHRYAYDIGVAFALTLKQGLRVEKAPVPVDAQRQMAATLRLLHAVDLQLRRTLAAAVNGNAQAFAAESAKLGTVAAPLNRRFDAVGLRDCGSNQQ
jgi:hypothetical protein